MADWKKMAQNAKARMHRIREKTEEATEAAIGTVVTVGTATGFSYARARLGDNGRILLAGVDADLLAGLGLHVVAFFGGFGKYSSVGHSAGNGALACYGVHKGFELGAEAKDKAAGFAPGPRQVTAGHQVPMGSAFERAMAGG